MNDSLLAASMPMVDTLRVRVGLPILLLWLLALSGCAAPTRTTVLSFTNLDCASCGFAIAKQLDDETGIRSAKFDKKRAELRIEAQEDLDVLALVTPLAKAKKTSVTRGQGKGSYVKKAEPSAALDVKQLVDDGSELIVLKKAVVPNKVTVFEYGAVWCGPCRKVDQHMFELLAKRDDLAYRKLDVGDWDSPLAKAHLQAVASTLPYIVVFDKRGKRVGAIDGAKLQQLDNMIAKASTSGKDNP